jgi:hypothetical protein
VTSPQNVGQVSVDLVVEAKALAAQIRKEVEGAFKGLDLSKLIQDSVGTRTVKLPVEPDFDTDSIPEKVRRTRVPKVPVELDPVVGAFQAEVKRQTAALARQVHVDVPIGADAGGLRAELGAQLAAVQAQAKIRVPTEPGAKAEYEAKLKADLAEVAAKVKQTVHVNVDVDKPGVAGIGGSGGLSSIFKGISNLLPNFGAIASGIADIGGAIEKAAGSSAQLGGNLAGAFESATGPIGIIIGLIVVVGATATAVFTGVAGAITFVIPAVTALAGALAALPGALTGIGAAAGTLLLGFKGISDAFKPKAGGGGGAGNSASQQARQIAAASRQVESARRGIAAANRGLEASERSLAAAERGVLSAEHSYADAQDKVVEAQKRAVSAQQAVNRARVEATEDLSDLNRELRGAKLSEEEATLAVTDALRDLNEVKLTGNIPDIQRAELAYERAQLSLEDATDTAQDLGEAADDANKKGVEGSDKVQSALQDQADAYKAVKDAQQGVLDAQNGMIDAADALKSAQDGVLSAQDSIKSAQDGLLSAQDSLAAAQTKTASGASAAAKEITKLAPAAQKFVDAIKALKPAFEDLRLDVQQRLFEGLDKTVTNLGAAWIPALKVTLGSYADTFNNFFKNLGASISTPKFISDLQAGAEGFRQLLDKVGASITDDLVPAFGALSRASAPFLSALGDELAHVVTQFSNWVLQGEKSGGLTSFFDRASVALHDIFDIGGTVASIIGSIFEIITGSSPTAGQSNPLETFKAGLQKIADYLADPANQQKIITFINTIQSALNQVLAAGAQVQGMFSTLSAAFNSGGQSLGADLAAGILTGLALSVAVQTELLKQTGMALISGVLQGAAAATELLGKFFSGLWHSIIDKAKEIFGISSPSTVFASIGQFLILGLINGIGSLLGSLSARMQNVRATVINAVSGAGSWLVATGRNALIGMMNGLNSMFRNLGIIAGNARVYVQNALVNAGNWLYQHGRAVISGLINGISSMLGTLGGYLGSIGSFIQAHKGPLDADKKLLIGAGQAIMGGLIGGIGSQKDALAAELADVTSIVAGTGLPSLGVEADAVSRSLSVADNKSLSLGWKVGSTGDQLLDALAKLIDIKHNGDVQAALSRT